jgi:hypothetical protein
MPVLPPPVEAPKTELLDAQDERSLLVSYLTLRRIVGALGLALPVVLWLISRTLQPSISAYYDLDHSRDVFVGVLFAIGFFLLTYRGYERTDDICGYISFVCALGVSLFRHNGSTVVSRVHFGSAAVLFLTFAYYSWFLFTKTSGATTPQKRIRNRVYRASAVIIVACLAIVAAHFLSNLGVTGNDDWPPLFWLEFLMLWAFGASWLVKGETLWPDPVPAAGRSAERRVTI